MDISDNINWYPGHMAKTRREIEGDLKLIDLVCEIIDARIPRSSRNPDVEAIVRSKPRLVILNRADQADPEITKLWRAHYLSEGVDFLECDSSSGKGLRNFSQAARTPLKDKLESRRSRGQAGRPIRAMVLGIPNVGKSTFINKLSGRKSAKVSDRPGVTRGKQWITVGGDLELMDTPGVLWPRLGDRETMENLAFTGAIKDEVLDIEDIACCLLARLRIDYPDRIEKRYGIEMTDELTSYELLGLCAEKRAFRISGGELDTRRMAIILVDEFRGGMLGRISLEKP